jgi:hypothetical protein
MVLKKLNLPALRLEGIIESRGKAKPKSANQGHRPDSCGDRCLRFAQLAYYVTEMIGMGPNQSPRPAG